MAPLASATSDPSGRDIEAVINYNCDVESSSSSATGPYVPFIGEPTRNGIAPVKVTLHDARPAIKHGELGLATSGFTLADSEITTGAELNRNLADLLSHQYGDQTDLVNNMSSPIGLEDLFKQNLSRQLIAKAAMSEDMRRIIQRESGAPFVHVFATQVRDKASAEDFYQLNPFASGEINGYVDMVHTDFSSKKSVEKLFSSIGRAQLGEFTQEQLLSGRYMLVNGWRNASDQHPIHDDMLAVCDARSVDLHSDLVRCEVSLDRALFELGDITIQHAQPPAEQYRLKANASSKHRWYYFPAMKVGEVLLFKQFDSDHRQGSRICFHTSFTDPSPTETVPPRKSIEIRALCVFPDIPRPEALLPMLSAEQQLAASMDNLECIATRLDECTCGKCSSPVPLPPQEKLAACECPLASNPYHTCVVTCGCSCASSEAKEAFSVPSWVTELYSAEDRLCNTTLFLLKGVQDSAGLSRQDWDSLLHKDVVLMHTVGTDQKDIRSVQGLDAALTAAASAAASPLNRNTIVQRFRYCGSSCCDQLNVDGEDSKIPHHSACAVVEGELHYDHKLTREKVQVPFVAHLVLENGLLTRRHTFSGSAAAEELVQRCGKLWMMLEMNLYAGAAHGMLKQAHVSSEVDSAALIGSSTARVIGRICEKHKCIPEWAKWAYHTGI